MNSPLLSSAHNNSTVNSNSNNDDNQKNNTRTTTVSSSSSSSMTRTTQTQMDERLNPVDELSKDLNDLLPANFVKPEPIRPAHLRIDHNKYLLVSGSNKEGQIGLGDSVERINILERIKSPPEFTTAKIVKIFCAPLHSIFITTDNHIYICGNNGNCRLGLGEKSSDMSKKRMPTRITEPEAFVQEKIIHVACGENHTLFLAESGHVWSCGGNHKGQLGLTAQEAPNNLAKQPTRVSFFNHTKVKMVACGLEHTIFLTEEHKVYSCGAGDNGQLGLGHNQAVSTPTLIPTFINCKVIKIECGFYFSVFVTENMDIYTCGRNHYGQLCQGTVTPLNIPTKIQDHLLPWKLEPHSLGKCTDIADIYCGQHHMICVLECGEIYVGGWNGYGQLGLGDLRDRKSFEKLTFFEQRNMSVRVTTCGAAHTAFITDTNELWVCGYNTAGQLALGHENAKVHTLQRVRHPALKHKKIVDVKCGTVHTIVVTEALKSKSELLRKSIKNMPEMEKLMFDSEIITKDGEVFPICDEFVEIRCPSLGKGKRRVVNLSEAAVKVLLYFCLSDELPTIEPSKLNHYKSHAVKPNSTLDRQYSIEKTQNAFLLLDHTIYTRK
jgi:alpha-tubulin suppressor-like RCC1 family protein